MNFTSRQSTLNMSEAAVDSDGRVRLVIALMDPGLANWLDPCGHRTGVFVLRNYLASADPDIETHVVKLSELDAALPAETRRATPSDRRVALARRRAGMTQRLGE